MPLLTEREHMQLWCPEARTVIVDFGGPKVATIDNPGMQPNQVEASPALNRMDFGSETGLRIPNSCLCFGSRCGAWQWSHWVRGRDGKHYATREVLARTKPDAMPCEQLGYCGKAAPFGLVPPNKPTSLPAPANDQEAQATNEPPKGETLQ